MQFDFNVGPNQSQHIDVVGSFVKYKGGAGTIRVRLNGGGYIDLLPGQGVNGVNFTSVDVQDRTGAQNAGTILAGIYDFRDDRITGTVEVIDGGRGRTLAGQCYATGGGYSGATATDYPYLILNNPAGSGRRVIVEEAFCTYLGVATGYVTAFIGAGAFGIAARSAPNKISGGPPSAAQFSVFNGAAQAGAEMYTCLTKEGQEFHVSAREPIIILPGYNFHMRAPLGASPFGGYFDFYEEVI